MKTKQILACTSLAMAALLSACGGGSDSGSGGAITVSGTVIKGPMDKARVTAYKVKADGTLGDKLGETVSSANGSYTLDFKDYSGVVVIEATATASTEMYDEATGEKIKPAAGFKLRAALNSTGGAFTAQINPLSEVAVAAAEKTGGFSRDNVEKTNKDLRDAVGFDPMDAKPEFDAQGKPSNKAAVAMATISKMAASDDIAACASQVGQAAKVKCVVETVADKGLNDDTVKGPFTNHAAGVADQAGLPDTAKPVITNPSNTTPAPTALAQTKAFMTTLRSNAKALDAADLSLQTELQAVASDMQNRVAPFADSTLDAFDLATQAAAFWASFQTMPNPSFPVLVNFSRSGLPLGGCRLYSDTGYVNEAKNRAEAKYVACGTSSPLNWDSNSNAMVAWSTRVRLHPGSTAGQFTVYTQTRRAVWVWNGATYQETTPFQRIHYGAAFPGNMATLKLERNAAGELSGVQFAGEMSPAFELSYGAEPPYAVSTAVLGDKLKVNLDGRWTVSAAGVNHLALQGSLAQYTTLNQVDNLQTALALEEGSYIKGSTLSVVGSSSETMPVLALAAASSGYDGTQEMLLNMRFATAQSALIGQFFVGNFAQDASQLVYEPTKLSFSGRVERKGVAFFEGGVTAEQIGLGTFRADLPLSLTNTQRTKMSLAGKISLPNRPVMSANLVINATDAGSSVSSTLSGQYRQGALVVNLSGQLSSVGNSQITLESTDGIKMVVNSTQSTHTMTKSGTAVATFNSSTSRLTYADNTFEQF